MRDAFCILFGAEVEPPPAPPEVMLILEADTPAACEDVPRRLFGTAFWTLAWRFIRSSDLKGRERDYKSSA